MFNLSFQFYLNCLRAYTSVPSITVLILETVAHLDNSSVLWIEPCGDYQEMWVKMSLLYPLSEKCIAYLSKTDLDHLVSLAFQTAPVSSQFALWYYSRERSDSPLIPCICSSSALHNTACQDDKHNKWLPTKGITLWKKTNLSHLTNLSQISCGALM